MFYERLNRREFVGSALAVGVVLLLPDRAQAHDAEGTVEPYEYLLPPHTPEKAETVALTLAEAKNAVKDSCPTIDSPQDATVFIDAFVPYLALTGMVDEGDLVYPRVEEVDFEEAGIVGTLYLLGRSNCGSGPQGEAGDGTVQINERFFSKYSVLERKDRNAALVATLAHEVSHSNKASCQPINPLLGDMNMVEGTTDLVTANALCAMAMDGSPTALPAAFHLISEMAHGYVFTEYYKEGKLERYEYFLSKLPQHSLAEGRWALIKAKGDEQISGYANVMKTYSADPYEVMSGAMNTDQFMTRSLPLQNGRISLSPIAYVMQNVSHFVYDILHP